MVPLQFVQTTLSSDLAGGLLAKGEGPYSDHQGITLSLLKEYDSFNLHLFGESTSLLVTLCILLDEAEMFYVSLL